MCTHTFSLSRSYYSFIKMFHNHNHDDVDAGSGSCHRTKQETEKSWKNEWGCLRPSLTFSCIFLQATEWMIFKSSTISPTTTSWRGERRASTLSSWPSYLTLWPVSFPFSKAPFLFEAKPPPPPPPTKKGPTRVESLYGGPFVSHSNSSRNRGSRAAVTLCFDTEKLSLVRWVGFGKCCFFQFLW